MSYCPTCNRKMNVVHVGLHGLGTGFVCDHTFYELHFTSRKRLVCINLSHN